MTNKQAVVIVGLLVANLAVQVVPFLPGVKRTVVVNPQSVQMMGQSKNLAETGMSVTLEVESK